MDTYSIYPRGHFDKSVTKMIDQQAGLSLGHRLTNGAWFGVSSVQIVLLHVFNLVKLN